MAIAAPEPTDEDTSQPVPDDLKDRIVTALIRNALIDTRRVAVTAAGGQVILTGAVRSWAERHEAERVVRAAPGVIGVDNHVTVLP